MIAPHFLIDAPVGSTKDVTSSLKAVIIFLAMIIFGIGVFIWWLKR
jgi:hypothetical protein